MHKTFCFDKSMNLDGNAFYPTKKRPKIIAWKEVAVFISQIMSHLPGCVKKVLLHPFTLTHVFTGID